MENLNDYTKGIWADDPNAEKKMKEFLTLDLYSDPNFAEDSKAAESRMKLRLDSRGEVIKRALVGDK